MIRGMYSIASALETATTNQDLVAENLAHVATPGYRRHALLFETFNPGANGEHPAAQVAGVRTAGQYTSFDVGPIQQTGNPYDLAIAGNAFFVVDGPSGPLYTRNGSFQVNAAGELQTKSGLRVRGLGGPINIPPGARTISIGSDGGVMADGNRVGQIQLAAVDNPGLLRRAGVTLFEGPPPRPPAPGTARIEQGFREGSNVQVVQEMVSMMLGMRRYESAERALRTMHESVGLNTRPE